MILPCSQGVNSALSTYFFGPNRDQKLTIEKFLEFQQQLQREILSLEVNYAILGTTYFRLGLELILIVLQFRRKGLREDGKLSEVDFAEMLLAYAGYPAKRKTRMIKRVRKGYGGNFFSARSGCHSC